MKKIINKIKEILTADVGKSLDRLELWDFFYNVFEFVCVKIIYNIYRFTLRPFVLLLDSFFTSFKKTKIAILIWILTFNFFVHMGTSLERVPPKLGYSSNEYFKNSQMITEEKMGLNTIKMTYYYENISLEGCKKNYQLTWDKTKNIYEEFNITGTDCNQTFAPIEKKRLLQCEERLKNKKFVAENESCDSKKTTHQYYTYKIVAEASLFRKISSKIESLKISLPYYFWGVCVVLGSILLFPFLIIFNI